MKITFLQSADAIRYRRFIEITSATIREYCALHNMAYESYLGICRGAKPWHAALNRIPILKSHSDIGYDGWIIYVDSDAYIADLGFDLRSYLSERSNYAMIAAPSGLMPPRWWDVNDGVFAINLGHDKGRELIDRWHDRLVAIPEPVLADEERWGDVLDDQNILHLAMEEVDGFEAALLRDDTEPRIFNWDNRFIKQLVRDAGSLPNRLTQLANAVDGVLNSERPAHARDTAATMAEYNANEEFIKAIYGVLLGRAADPGGFNSAMNNFRNGDRTYSQDMRACLGSAEFAGRLPAFLREHIDPAKLAQLVETLRTDSPTI